MNTQRRPPRIQERLTPCECCGYKLSQRHHLLEVADWGENTATVQLCANCHELYHLLYGAYVTKSERCIHLAGQFILKVGFGDSRVTYLKNLVNKSESLKIEVSKTAAMLATMDDEK